MAGKQRAPYLQVAFPGPVGRFSEGKLEGHWTRRAYVDMGPYRVRGVVSDTQMSSALYEAAGRDDVEIRLGHMLHGRWVLAVSFDGHSERHGLFMFLLCNLALGLIFLIIGALFALVVSELLGSRVFLSWPILPWLGLWAVHLWLNFKARFGG